MSASGEGRFSLASVGRSASYLVGATALVQIVGLVRELYLAAQVGVSAQLDAAIVGLAPPLILSTVLTAGARTALVPAYIDAQTSGEPVRARYLAGIVVVWVGIAGAIIACLLTLFAPFFIEITGPGMDQSAKAAAAGYLRVTAPIAVAMGVSSVLSAVCQAEDLFGWIAGSIIISPLVTLAIMLGMWGDLGLDALALGSLVGPFVSLVLLTAALARRRITPIPRLYRTGVGLRGFVRHALPLTVSASILQFNSVIDRAIASLVAPGAISALRYGDSLVRAPISAMSPAWGAGLYPALVRSAHDKDQDRLGSATYLTLRFTVAAFVPIAALAAAVAPLAVAVLYGRGSFGSDDIALVSRILVAFSPLIAILMIQPVLVGALNARRKGGILLAAGILHVVLNAVFDVLFGISIGVVGVALSSTLTVAAVVLFQGAAMRRAGIAVPAAPVFRAIGLAALAVLPGALIIGAMCWTGTVPTALLPGLLALAVFAVVGLSAYVLVARRIGYEEPKIIADAALRLTVERLRLRLRRSRGVAQPQSGEVDVETGTIHTVASNEPRLGE